MAAGNTYVALASTTLTTTTASVTFSSISSAYTDLVIVVTGQGVYTSTDFLDVGMQYNGDTGSNYSTTRIRGYASEVNGARNSSETSIRAAFIHGLVTASAVHSSMSINIFNYSNTTTYKTMVSRSGYPTAVSANIGLWNSTSAITSVLLKNNDSASGFHTGTTFQLFGIAAA